MVAIRVSVVFCDTLGVPGEDGTVRVVTDDGGGAILDALPRHALRGRIMVIAARAAQRYLNRRSREFRCCSQPTLRET